MMFRAVAIAFLSIFLLGATTVSHPACIESPEQYASFLTAIMEGDSFVVQFYEQTGCGMLKADMPATIVEEGPFWVRVIVEPEGVDPIYLYTSPGAIKEDVPEGATPEQRPDPRDRIESI